MLVGKIFSTRAFRIGSESCATQKRLTKRAPDVWDSAAFSSIFLASSFSYISSRIHARPHAGNANRWQELAVDLSSVFQN
jgi:hypothetical protein